MPGDFFVGLPVFSLRRFHYVCGKLWAGRLLVPADALEIVAHELLIERWLCFARRVLIGWPKARRIGRQGFINPDDFIADQAEFEFRVSDNNSALCCPIRS